MFLAACRALSHTIRASILLFTMCLAGWRQVGGVLCPLGFRPNIHSVWDQLDYVTM